MDQLKDHDLSFQPDDHDLSFQPDELLVPEDLQHEASTAGKNLADALSISPAPFQLSKTPIRQLWCTLRAMKGKLVQVQESM